MRQDHPDQQYHQDHAEDAAGLIADVATVASTEGTNDEQDQNYHQYQAHGSLFPFPLEQIQPDGQFGFPLLALDARLLQPLDPVE